MLAKSATLVLCLSPYLMSWRSKATGLFDWFS